MTTEQELIGRAQAGEQQALTLLLKRYEKKLFTYLVRMLGSREAAEDVTQETFIKVIKNVKSYREEGNFKAWIYTIARREALKVIRKYKNTSSEQNVEEICAAQTTPEETLAGKQQREKVERALQLLDIKEREVMILRLKDDLKFREIANVTGTPLNTVLSRMRTATKKVQALLNEEGRDEI